MGGAQVPEPQVAAIANLLLALAEGRMHQYVRSGFARAPLEFWDEQWALLRPVVAARPAD